MEIKNSTIESFLKSFTFSFLLCLYCGFLIVARTRALLKDFDFTELLWLIYNVIVALLFLIRVRPSVVSMNPIHWTVALVTSFSGFFFVRKAAISNPVLVFATDVIMLFAILLAISASLTLGRSFGFLPALRRVRTEFVYQIVRHPMYLSSIIIKFGYVLKNPSIYNILLLALIIVLYDKRAKYEEHIMSNSNSYLGYLQQVRFRFIPGIY